MAGAHEACQIDMKEMSATEAEIVVDDPTAPADALPAVASTRTVEMVLYAPCWRSRC